LISNSLKLENFTPFTSVKIRLSSQAVGSVWRWNSRITKCCCQRFYTGVIVHFSTKKQVRLWFQTAYT